MDERHSSRIRMKRVRFNPYFLTECGNGVARTHDGVVLGMVQKIDGSPLYIVEGVNNAKGITVLAKEYDLEFEEEVK